MAFLNLTPPQPRRRGVDLALICAGAALTLILVAQADDEVTGRAHLGDAVGFTAAFLATGGYLAALPHLWRWSHGRTVAAVVMPEFVALVLGFFFLGLRSYFVQPDATGPALLLQLLLLVGISCRSI